MIYYIWWSSEIVQRMFREYSINGLSLKSMRWNVFYIFAERFSFCFSSECSILHSTPSLWAFKIKSAISNFRIYKTHFKYFAINLEISEKLWRNSHSSLFKIPSITRLYVNFHCKFCCKYCASISNANKSFTHHKAIPVIL